jgi:uncharacterized RDD family membrane protein YckC
MKIMDKTLSQLFSQGLETVGFWRRALAFFIDMIIINIIILSPFRNTFYMQFKGLSISDIMEMGSIAFPVKIYWMIFIISLLALVYFASFEYYVGQTPGQALTKIRVISLRKDDENISFWRAAIRNCYVIPFFPFYIFWIIEPIYLGLYRERLLEKVTFTKTVYESNYDRKDKKNGKINSYKDYKLEKV